MKRRQLLQAASLAATAAAAGCKDLRALTDPRPGKPTAKTPRRAATPPLTADAATHLLNRAAFGATPDERERLQAMGVSAWIEEQLAAPGDSLGPQTLLHTDENPGLQWRLNGIEVLRARSGYELRDMPQAELLTQLQKAALLRAAYSKWQLRERMADFWTNHFNIYARKVVVDTNPGAFRKVDSELMYWLGVEQGQVIRQNALGNFGTLIEASMKSPAMLGYLDNQINKKGVPNENYARELMELHTLGVGGGYTQQDVKEVARCLTGWTIEHRFLHKVGTVYFEPSLHDTDEKKVLGQIIPAGGGEKDAYLVREILLDHPSTAAFLARKLVRYFYGDGEQAPLLERKVIAAYAGTSPDRKDRGDIKAMLRALLLAPEFGDAKPVIKRPFDYLVSSVRTTGAITDGDRGIQDHLFRMGQPLYQWPMPDGYPDRTAAWAGSLLARWNFALALAQGQIGGTTIEAAPALEALGGGIIDTVSAAERVALALSTPAFQWR